MKRIKLSFTFLIVSHICVTVAHAEIIVEGALVDLIETVEVPAREPGVLAEFAAAEGQLVKENDLLARIDDAQAALDEEKAEIELAKAKRLAENDVSVRFAKKSVEVAKAEQRRAEESIATFPKSISQSEIDRLRLTVERSILEVEQAEEERELAAFDQALKSNELKTARQHVARRRITAPIAGVVAQVFSRRGEWVEPGETVVRLLRVDRLRVEAFVSVDKLTEKLEESPVELTVDLPGRPGAKFTGKVVFVSPEVDPVNREVRVWAEVENRDLQLRPGLRGKLVIK